MGGSDLRSIKKIKEKQRERNLDRCLVLDAVRTFEGKKLEEKKRTS